MKSKDFIRSNCTIQDYAKSNRLRNNTTKISLQKILVPGASLLDYRHSRTAADVSSLMAIQQFQNGQQILDSGLKKRRKVSRGGDDGKIKPQKALSHKEVQNSKHLRMLSPDSESHPDASDKHGISWPGAEQSPTFAAE